MQIPWFEWSLKQQGFPIDRAKSGLENIDHYLNEDPERFNECRGKQIFKHHFKSTPFYTALCNREYTVWEEIPILTKSHLQQPLEKRLNSSYRIKDCYINKTSGSSGHPFVFAKDRMCHALTWANIILLYKLYEIDINYSVQARFYGIPLETKGKIKELVKDRLSRRHRFRIFDMSDKVMETFTERFRKTRFDYINGYTSSIVLFAKYLSRREIILKDICPSLRLCIVTSEMLFDEDRALLEKQLGISVVNEYGASELDIIAFENPGGEWRINERNLYIEICDENGKSLPMRTEGRIIITALNNLAHPFIRYDIGDTGILGMNAENHPVLKKLTGRTNDYALLPDGKKVPGLSFYYVTKSIMDDEGSVKEFVIEQTQPDHLLIRYVSSETLTRKQEQTVKDAVAKYVGTGLNVALQKTEFLDRSRNGKLRQFTRSF